VAPKTNDYHGSDESNLRVEPGPAGGNFTGAGLFVDAAFPTWFPLEMFHYIGDMNFFAINTCFEERSLQQTPGRSDKRLSVQIFVVSRLFAYEHDASFGSALAKNSLCGVFPKRTIFAIASFIRQFLDGFGKEIRLPLRTRFRQGGLELLV
jgi:hypothetical protein